MDRTIFNVCPCEISTAPKSAGDPSYETYIAAAMSSGQPAKCLTFIIHSDIPQWTQRNFQQCSTGDPRNGHCSVQSTSSNLIDVSTSTLDV